MVVFMVRHYVNNHVSVMLTVTPANVGIVTRKILMMELRLFPILMKSMTKIPAMHREASLEPERFCRGGQHITIASRPKSSSLQPAAAFHDFQYSCPRKDDHSKRSQGI